MLRLLREGLPRCVKDGGNWREKTQGAEWNREAKFLRGFKTRKGRTRKIEANSVTAGRNVTVKKEKREAQCCERKHQKQGWNKAQVARRKKVL